MSQQTQINTAAASATSPQAELGGFTSPPTPRAETALSLEHQAALNFAAKAGKQRYIDRISALVNTGRITPDYANKTLAPFLQDLQLSFDAQGEPVSTELDKLLLALEALPQNQILGAPLTAAVRRNGDQMFALAVPGAAEIPNDHLWQSADTGTPSEEEAQAIVNQQFENTGRAHMIRGPRNWAGRQS